MAADPSGERATTTEAVQHLLRALTSLAPQFTEMDADEETAVREAQLRSDAEAREAMRAERAAQRRAAKAEQQKQQSSSSAQASAVTTPSGRLVSYLNQRAAAREAGGAELAVPAARVVMTEAPAKQPTAPRVPWDRRRAEGDGSWDRRRAEGEGGPPQPWARPDAAPAHPPGHLSGKLRDLGGRIVQAKEQRLAFIAQLSGAARAEEPPSSSFGATSLSGVPEPYPSPFVPGSGGRRRRPRSASPAAPRRDDEAVALRRQLFQQRRAEISAGAAASRAEAAAEALRAEQAAQEAAEAARARPARVIVVLHDQPAAETARWRRECGFRAEPKGAARAPVLAFPGTVAAPQAALDGLDAAVRQGSALLWVGRRARMMGPGAKMPQASALSLEPLLALTDAAASGHEAEVLFVPACRVGGMRAVLASRLERAAGALAQKSPLALPAADPARALDGIALTLVARYGLRILPRPDLLPLALLPADALPPLSPAAAPAAPSPSAGPSSGLTATAAPAAPGALFRHNPRGREPHAKEAAPAQQPPTSASVTQTVRGILRRKSAARQQDTSASLGVGASKAPERSEGVSIAPGRRPPSARSRFGADSFGIASLAGLPAAGAATQAVPQERAPATAAAQRAWVPSAAPLPRSRQR